MISKKAPFIAGTLLLCVVFGTVQHVAPVHASEASIAASVTVTALTESYGTSVVDSSGISSPEAALGEQDGSGATMSRGGWVSIELVNTIAGCTDVSIWAAKSSKQSPNFDVYVSADGSTWTEVGSGSCTSESYTRYDFSGAFGDVRYIKVGHNGPPPAKMLLDALWAKVGVSYTLTVSSGGCCSITVGDLGTVNPNSSTEFSIASCTDVTLTANEPECCGFQNWTGDVPGGSSADNPITIHMDSNKSVTGHCSTLGPYTLTVSIEPEGTGSVLLEPAQPAEGYACGADVTLTASPSGGYRFSHWSGDLGGSDNPTTIHMDSNNTATAHFAAEITESYGASIAGSFGVSSSDAALGQPDGSGATMRGGGWVSIELKGMLTNCTDVSIWAAKSSKQSPNFYVYVSVDGSNWTEVGSGSCTSTSYIRYDFSGAFGDVMYIKVSRNGPASAKMLLDAVWAKRQ